jgi:hypothetical protein
MFVRRVSWGAIFAGVVVAAVTHLVLMLLGMGIGLYAIDPQETGAGESLAIGTGIWWIIVTVISLAAGGWVSARLAGIPRRIEGALHGLATWGVTTLATIFLLGSAVGGIIGGGWNVMQTAMQQGQGPDITVIVPGQQQGQGPQDPQVQPGLGQVLPEQGPMVTEGRVNTVAAASLWTFFVLVLGAVAAGVSGLFGSPHHLPVLGVDVNEHERRERDKRQS